MTSDAQPSQSYMALIQPQVDTHQVVALAVDEDKTDRHGAPKKASDERAHLLPAMARDGRTSPVSALHTNNERVYPCPYESAVLTNKTDHTASPAKTIDGDQQQQLIVRARPSVMTKLFGKTVSTPIDISPSLKESGHHASEPRSYGSIETKRRNSILRMNSARSPHDRQLKKSASVEFMLHDEEVKEVNKSRRMSGSNFGRDMPRRLTIEEKEELYRERPDLEIGPAPFFQEHLDELRRRNQRRLLYAIFGGVLCLVFLMVFYYLLTIE
ncbi:hypothetical protein Poli38472_008631 [Pythium oligandrum]|uniref:Uncharacterized protein n=1 Tax=Pythium oligandrum TaxID=41045 RepID=A0A8K1C3X4_PYTOL|nr:hypothetical protein Poli38472_008631 [Pythium oligandrum]|eukprot:TMW55983.1 hypothetical protein Poli38472_008631 [Pythium oligandrum]